MADTKQPHLNGAYYGPSIPPPSKSYHRPGRGGSCCCNPFSCLLNCLCTCVCQILCAILVVVGIVVLVCWLIFRPNEVKFYASGASLTQFNLDNNTMLQYNLAVNLTIRNPNRRIGVYYDRIEATAMYEGNRLNTKELQPFYQGHKSTNFLNAEFNGQQLILLGANELSDHNQNKISNVYDIDVKLRLRIRLKLGVVKTPRMKPKIECDLKIPLSSNSNTTSVVVFESKRCDFDWR
ncbi:NDR1/HIN1-like protein 2 [Primulina eburnea]|uniref:NDR1/HIN1-like protein 2 n=1 Tax=Primulina eburnea TaxID=1245227 RepID=UPI003C6C7602